MTALPSKHYSGHKATDGNGDLGTLWKGPGEGNVDGRLQVQLEEDGGGTSRQSQMESNSLWSMLHSERRDISQVVRAFDFGPVYAVSTADCIVFLFKIQCKGPVLATNMHHKSQ